jgi:hypothetical protein
MAMVDGRVRRGMWSTAEENREGKPTIRILGDNDMEHV